MTCIWLRLISAIACWWSVIRLGVTKYITTGFVPVWIFAIKLPFKHFDKFISLTQCDHVVNKCDRNRDQHWLRQDNVNGFAPAPRLSTSCTKATLSSIRQFSINFCSICKHQIRKCVRIWRLQNSGHSVQVLISSWWRYMATQIRINISAAHGLLPDGTMPLLNYYQRGLVALTWCLFRRKCSIYISFAYYLELLIQDYNHILQGPMSYIGTKMEEM